MYRHIGIIESFQRRLVVSVHAELLENALNKLILCHHDQSTPIVQEDSSLRDLPTCSVLASFEFEKR